MTRKKFAEQEVLAIYDILQEQLRTTSGTEQQFRRLQQWLRVVLDQNSVEEMDPNYEGTFEELQAYAQGWEKSGSATEHVNVHQQNIARWLEEIHIYNTKETVTTDDRTDA